MNIVLDLDATLILTYEEDDAESIYHSLNIHTENFELKKDTYFFELEEKFTWGILRPGVIDFLQWADKFFDNVIIWSAGTDSYVKKIVRILYDRSKLKYPQIVYKRSHCSFNEKNDFCKRLDQLFDQDYCRVNGITKYNTLLLDDNRVNHKPNPDNTFLIPAYSPEITVSGIINKSDDILMRVKDWYLNIPDDATDIRMLKKPNFKKK